MSQVLALRPLAAVLSAILFCAPAAATTYPLSQSEQIDNALSDYLSCVRRMAEQFDDGRAPIDEVMASASGACIGQQARLVEAASHPEVIGNTTIEPWENRDWIQARLLAGRQMLRSYLEYKRDSNASNP